MSKGSKHIMAFYLTSSSESMIQMNKRSVEIYKSKQLVEKKTPKSRKKKKRNMKFSIACLNILWKFYQKDLASIEFEV